MRGVVAFGEAAPEVVTAFSGVAPRRTGADHARRGSPGGRAGGAGRRGVAVAGVRIVRRVPELRAHAATTSRSEVRALIAGSEATRRMTDDGDPTVHVARAG